MLIDFETLHRTYLIGSAVNGTWLFTPTNHSDPRKGFYPCSHQVFSNHALQIALSIYNSVDGGGNCISVSHCLYLLFSKKTQGTYLLTKDPARIAFHLDVGVAGELYGLAVGHTESIDYKAIRPGKAPKAISGTTSYRDGRRVVVLRASSSTEGRATSVEVELDHASSIALAAYCLGYGRLLYPSLSDAAVQGLLSNPHSYSRACAENPLPVTVDAPNAGSARAEASRVTEAESVRHAVAPAMPFAPDVVRLHKVIWAIGNQKWPSMQLSALQAMQKLDDLAHLKRLIDSGNAGDFREWDAFLG